jgi:hypothetical protein
MCVTPLVTSWSPDTRFGNSVNRNLDVSGIAAIVHITESTADSHGFGESRTETITTGPAHFFKPHQSSVAPTSFDLCSMALSTAATSSSSRVNSLLVEGSSPSS